MDGWMESVLEHLDGQIHRFAPFILRCSIAFHRLTATNQVRSKLDGVLLEEESRHLGTHLGTRTCVPLI
jgi:hypothetical protein